MWFIPVYQPLEYVVQRIVKRINMNYTSLSLLVLLIDLST